MSFLNGIQIKTLSFFQDKRFSRLIQRTHIWKWLRMHQIAQLLLLHLWLAELEVELPLHLHLVLFLKICQQIAIFQIYFLLRNVCLLLLKVIILSCEQCCTVVLARKIIWRLIFIRVWYMLRNALCIDRWQRCGTCTIKRHIFPCHRTKISAIYSLMHLLVLIFFVL